MEEWKIGRLEDWKTGKNGIQITDYGPLFTYHLSLVTEAPMALSGQKTITTAGTAEALGSQRIGGPLMVKALTTNSGLAYLGSDGAGDVAANNGMPLEAGDVVVFEWVGSLASLMVDVAVDGEGVAWMALDV